MKHDILILTAFFAITGLRFIGLSVFPNAKKFNATITSTTQPIKVETTLTKKALSLGRISLNGTLEAEETATVSSPIMGQIKSLPVQEGQTFKAGQIIAIIDVQDIPAQRHQLLTGVSQAQIGVTVATAFQTQALANKTQAQAQLKQAKARQQEAKTKLQEAQAQLDEAQLNQQSMAMLRRDGAVSQSQLDTANAQVTLLKSRIQQTQAEIEQAKREIEQANAGLKQALFQVQQAQARAEKARLQVQQVQAGLKPATTNLDHRIVKAPFAGVVTKKHAQVSAIVGFGQPLLTLESSDRLHFNVAVPESMISLVKPGDEVEVQLHALNRSVRGRVSQIIPSANLNSRSFTAKIALKNPTNLMPGMFGRIELPHKKTLSHHNSPESLI
ncbi:MAG: efflux RND transporter periplasmic adaptor subunit [Nostoc sp. DedQUE12b]|uniref:efflux RND transporter periplasmic adaptor subunit n=1 Tax=Nostoc sp. DedQUE12b TaxID=3075398 RepID=UPI002AD52435|nr:efflux RND transporter periplasmic adaptor subunit [Nostoc sp. DedQUE12b]MDZ8084596.1 efflux RND transporter periplasmic adaptor subunit [Nostoc sp. DedQUE12b]